MKFRATPEDLAKGQIVSPGWLPVQLLEVEETTAKTDNSGLAVVRARVIGGKDEDKGAILRTQFSEKAPGFIKNFVEALTGKKFEANTDYQITTANVKDKRMEWYVMRGEYQGRPTNNVMDYRPLSS